MQKLLAQASVLPVPPWARPAAGDSMAWLPSPGIPGLLLDSPVPTHLCLHACPAFLLLLPPSHVLVLLLGLGHSLKELVKDAKELIGLHFVCVFSKVLHSLGKLEERGQGSTSLGDTHRSGENPPMGSLMEWRQASSGYG